MNKIIRFRFRVPAEDNADGWLVLEPLGELGFIRVAKLAHFSKCKYLFLYVPSDVFLRLMLEAIEDGEHQFIIDSEAKEMPFWVAAIPDGWVDPVPEDES